MVNHLASPLPREGSGVGFLPLLRRGLGGRLSIPVLPDSTLSGVLLRTFLIPSDHLVHVIDEFVERTHRTE